MKIKTKIYNLKILYIFFVFLSLNIFFFSTGNASGKAFDIDNIDISRPFEINFNKNDVINEGFEIAFFELIKMILNSSDQKKINQIKSNEIKGMIESFSIKEEKFINEIYYVNLGVSFNKKKIFEYLEKKNIFPSIPLKKNFLFIPIIIDEKNKDLLIFDKNEIFSNWNNNLKKTDLIQYILPTEDLEDLNIIKKNYDKIEQYDFKEITVKYDLKDSIITLIFKNDDQIRVLSKISQNDDVILTNSSFKNIDLKNEKQRNIFIDNLKKIYEDYWKNINQINTSIKLPINIKLQNNDNSKIVKFENILVDSNLIYDFFIYKYDKDFTYYQIIFNGTPTIFLKNMMEKNYNFDTQDKVWTLR